MTVPDCRHWRMCVNEHASEDGHKKKLPLTDSELATMSSAYQSNSNGSDCRIAPRPGSSRGLQRHNARPDASPRNNQLHPEDILCASGPARGRESLAPARPG